MYGGPREDMILSLAKCGYKCWIEEKRENNRDKFYVCFENKNIIVED